MTIHLVTLTEHDNRIPNNRAVAAATNETNFLSYRGHQPSNIQPNLAPVIRVTWYQVIPQFVYKIFDWLSNQSTPNYDYQIRGKKNSPIDTIQLSVSKKRLFSTKHRLFQPHRKHVANSFVHLPDSGSRAPSELHWADCYQIERLFKRNRANRRPYLHWQTTISLRPTNRMPLDTDVA